MRQRIEESQLTTEPTAHPNGVPANGRGAGGHNGAELRERAAETRARTADAPSEVDAAVTAPPTNLTETRKPAAPGRTPRRALIFAAAAIVLLAGAVWGSRWLAYNRVHVSTDDAAVDGDLYTVGAKVGGKVDQVLVGNNEPVHRGQLLATIDARDIQAQLEQARATLATEEANARAAGITVALMRKTTGSTTAQARAAVAAARAQVEVARQQAAAGRTQVPAAQAAVRVAAAGVQESRRQAEAGYAQVPAARAGVTAARAQTVAARQQVGVGRAQISSAVAGVAAAHEGVTDATNNVRSAAAGVTSAQEAVAEAEAGITAARQAVASAEAQVASAQNGVQVAAADVTAAQARARQATADIARAQQLFEGGAIPRQQLESAQEAATTAQAQVTAAQQRQGAATADVARAQAGVAAAQAGVAQAITRRNQAQAALTQAQITVQNSADAVRVAQSKVNQAVAGLTQAREAQGALQADVAQQQAKTVQAGAGVHQVSSSAAALRAAIAQQQAKVAQAATGVPQAAGNAAALQATVGEQQAKVTQAVAGLEGTATAPEQIGVSSAQARSALGKVMQARAQVDQLLLQLSYTRIVAPHDGVVSRKNIMVGQTVAVGQPLLTVVDLGAVDVVANFKETQLDGMRVGSPAEFTVDAYGGHIFHGHVASFSAGTGAVFSLLPPENASGNFTKVVQRVPVKIVLDDRPDPDRPLRLGMSTVVTVDLSHPPSHTQDQRAPRPDRG